MKNMYMVIGIVSVLVIGGLGGMFLFGGGDINDKQNNETRLVSEQQNDIASTQSSIEDVELMRFVDKDSIEYKNATSFQGEEYDQYFVANMIHYSEGLAQLEEKAVTSTNSILAEGAADRAKKALDDVLMYKQLQKDLGQPASYGQQMQYHGAMGTDAETYYAISSLGGLKGAEFETQLTKELKYFRRAETQLSGVGVSTAYDSRVKELVVKTLENNATILERLL